jgi:2-aminomuconate deaminase
MSALNLAMTEFNSESAPQAVGSYPHARRAGEFLFLSGVGPRSAGNNQIPGNIYDTEGNLLSYDIELQCHEVLKNVRNILSSCSSRWEDLVDITVFLTNMKQDFATFNQIYAEYFDEHRPCRTTVEVVALPTDIAIELKCIAHFSDQ